MLLGAKSYIPFHLAPEGTRRLVGVTCTQCGTELQASRPGEGKRFTRDPKEWCAEPAARRCKPIEGDGDGGQDYRV